MAPMTTAEKERSERICEIAGTVACALLTWPLVSLSLETRVGNSYQPEHDSPDSLMIGLLVFLSYYGVFVILDRWWLKHYAGKTSVERFNWLFIPFAGTFFSLLNIYLTAPQIRVVDWFIEILLVSMGYGVLLVCVMFCFWAFGLVMRYVRG